MDTDRHRACNDLLQMADATRDLRHELEIKESTYRSAAANLLGGVSVADTMSIAKTNEARRELSDALETFERLRHNSRISMSAAALAEGISIAQLGRAWGVSRQMAQRYAREATEASAT